MSRIAVVTGARRGLGLQTVRALAQRGWTVVLTARRDAILRASELDGEVIGHPLDVDDDASVASLSASLSERFGRLDALVNNAGVLGSSSGVAEVPASAALAVLQTNAIGALRVTRALLPLLLVEGGNIVNVSSGMGSLGEMSGGSVGYRMSKAALNALTRVTDAETPAHVRVNSVCPGWVRTDMGGSGAPRSLEDGAAGIVWAATLEAGGPSGGFFRDGRAIAW